jgi:hypothetical protein
MDFSLLLTLGLITLLTRPLHFSLQMMDMMFGLATAEETSIQELIKLLIQIEIKKAFLITAFKILEIMIFQPKFKK